MQRSLNLVDSYEAKHGALFLSDSTRDGVRREAVAGDGQDLARAMVAVQQAILEDVYTRRTVKACRCLLERRGWLTADHFPGKVTATVDPSATFAVRVNA